MNHLGTEYEIIRYLYEKDDRIHLGFYYLISYYGHHEECQDFFDTRQEAEEAAKKRIEQMHDGIN